MKRKYEGLVAFSKINAAVALVIGLSVFIFSLNGLTRGTPEQFLLLGAAVGFIGGAILVFAAAAGLDFLSDIEFSIRNPETQGPQLEEVEAAAFGDDPYSRPHALNVAAPQK
jgi:hypothetical protein